MTKLLEIAYDRVSQLPEQEQDTIASFILDETDTEERWIERFNASGDFLA